MLINSFLLNEVSITFLKYFAINVLECSRNKLEIFKCKNINCVLNRTQGDSYFNRLSHRFRNPKGCPRGYFGKIKLRNCKRIKSVLKLPFEIRGRMSHLFSRVPNSKYFEMRGR